MNDAATQALLDRIAALWQARDLFAEDAQEAEAEAKRLNSLADERDASANLLIREVIRDHPDWTTLLQWHEVIPHPGVVAVGGTFPAHVPGAYPGLSCCGGTKVMVVAP